MAHPYASMAKGSKKAKLARYSVGDEKVRSGAGLGAVAKRAFGGGIGENHDMAAEGKGAKRRADKPSRKSVTNIIIQPPAAKSDAEMPPPPAAAAAPPPMPPPPAPMAGGAPPMPDPMAGGAGMPMPPMMKRGGAVKKYAQGGKPDLGHKTNKHGYDLVGKAGGGAVRPGFKKGDAVERQASPDLEDMTPEAKIPEAPKITPKKMRKRQYGGMIGYGGPAYGMEPPPGVYGGPAPAYPMPRPAPFPLPMPATAAPAPAVNAQGLPVGWQRAARQFMRARGLDNPAIRENLGTLRGVLTQGSAPTPDAPTAAAPGANPMRQHLRGIRSSLQSQGLERPEIRSRMQGIRAAMRPNTPDMPHHVPPTKAGGRVPDYDSGGRRVPGPTPEERRPPEPPLYPTLAQTMAGARRKGMDFDDPETFLRNLVANEAEAMKHGYEAVPYGSPEFDPDRLGDDAFGGGGTGGGTGGGLFGDDSNPFKGADPNPFDDDGGGGGTGDFRHGGAVKKAEKKRIGGGVGPGRARPRPRPMRGSGVGPVRSPGPGPSFPTPRRDGTGPGLPPGLDAPHGGRGRPRGGFAAPSRRRGRP